jgi:isoquinoline 1-oxidoreductase beta subunit
VNLDRRRLLVGAAAGGGLLVGWVLWPRHYPPPLPVREGDLGVDGWLTVGHDGVVTVNIPQLEMGQGVQTVLAQVAAVELGADWRRVAVQPAPPAEIYANAVLAADWAALWMPAFPGLAADPEGWAARGWARRHRFATTADGTSLAACEAPLRHAAATARAMLVAVAARRWGVDAGECTVSGSRVRHGGQVLDFAQLTQSAARETPPAAPVLQPQAVAMDPALAGTGAGTGGFPRLDLPSRVDGSAVFAGDVRLPDMVFAAIRHAPIGAEAALSAADDTRAKGVPGFVGVVRGAGWLAAAASDWWAAERALSLIAPRFRVHRPVESLAIEAALDKGLRGSGGHVIAEAGDAAAVMAGHPTLTRRYDIAPAVHAGVETASAAARLRDGRIELWCASQAPEQARVAVAKALDLDLRDVLLYPVPAGGSFDARLEHDHAVEAAMIAKALGRPVSLTWSRWQEMVAGRPRPPVAATVSARVDGGMISAWTMRAALPAAAREFGARVLDGGDPLALAAKAGDHADAMALAGAVPPYAIPACRIEHVPVATGLPAGRLRGNAHGYTAFFTESLIDELAAELHREPLSFRIAMLEADPRLVACLQRVSTLAQWNGAGDGSGNGLACHRIGSIGAGGCIAAIARARRDETGVRVDRVVAVADIGRVVNADVARQQIEGGLVFGIGLALGASTGYAAGLPINGRLASLGLPLMADCPEVVIEIIASQAPAFDPGEIGVAVAAPAVANALASATGLRFRRLPLVSED